MKRALVLVSLLVCPPALAQWVNVHPGVDFLERNDPGPNHITALRVDLCTPGVRLGATAYEDRGRTTSSWAWSQSAKVAINGGFFGGNFSSDGGAAAGAGAIWPVSTDTNYRGWMAFGPGQMQHSYAHLVESLPAWTTDAVNGDATLVDNGIAIDCGGCGFNARHPRTALGYSPDRRTLFMVTVDGRSPVSVGMTIDELAVLMADFGVERAMNLDGGGSTTMYIRGTGVVNVPSDGSERVVGNHLGVFYDEASSSAPNCADSPPRGHLDQASCTVSGWAQDLDAPDAPIDVHIYIGGPAGSGAAGFPVSADVYRADLCSAIGSCEHGFNFPVPLTYRDGQSHPVHVYGINVGDTAPNAELQNSPLTITCAPPAPEPEPEPAPEPEPVAEDAGIVDAAAPEPEPAAHDAGTMAPEPGPEPDAGADDAGVEDASAPEPEAPPSDAGPTATPMDDTGVPDPTLGDEPEPGPPPSVEDGCNQVPGTSLATLVLFAGGLRRRRGSPRQR